MLETIGVRAREVPAMTARQRLIVALLLGANFMMSADFSILNIALPVVGESVGLSIDNLPWVSTAFALPAAGMSLLFGRLGDLYGRRRLFATGLALLAAASLLGGVSTGPAMLLAARALKGTAAAMTAPAALALLITTFADDRQRARVLGLNGTLLSAGFRRGACRRYACRRAELALGLSDQRALRAHDLGGDAHRGFGGSFDQKHASRPSGAASVTLGLFAVV